MFDLAARIRTDMDKLAGILTSEHGKTTPDAKGDITRGLEVVEHACGLSHINMGETFGNVSRGIDTYSYRIPLGVCAGISAYNFPAMIPLFMFPFAVTLGNTFVLKPSERVAGAALHLAGIMKDIGVPDGVFNVVHGGFETTKMITEHPDIRAISFIGGNKAGDYVYEMGAKHHKRM